MNEAGIATQRGFLGSRDVSRREESREHSNHQPASGVENQAVNVAVVSTCRPIQWATMA